MKSKRAVVSFAWCAAALGLAVLIGSDAPAWAGGAPAPLAGAVGGPVGLLAAAAAYGGYLLYKRYRRHD